MGRAVINLSDIMDLSENSDIPEPRWYPVKYKHDDNYDPENGPQVLVSFALVEYDHEFLLDAELITLDRPCRTLEPPIETIVMKDLEIEEYNIEINVLGFRNLLSTGLLPIKKAYAKFSLKSILPPSEAKAVQDVYTLPDESGTDPNVRTTLKFTVNIPSIESYVPSMTCTMYDKLYFDGMAQPILGTFTLKLGEILGSTRGADQLVVTILEELNEILHSTIDLKQGEDRELTVLQIVNKVKG